LLESLILSTIGGALGVAIAFFGARAILVLAFPHSENMPVSANPSWAVLAFAFGISVLTGLLFAGGPAWISSGAQPAEATRGHNSLARDRAVLPQRLLLIFQLSLSIILLASAFLATQSLYHLEHKQMGVATEHRYTVGIDLRGAGYAADQLAPVYRGLEDGLAKLPGLRRTTFTRYLPLDGNQWGTDVFVHGRPTPSAKENSFADWNRVSAGFLDSIGVPILRGRGLTQEDENSPLPVAIVNEAFVKRFFPGEDPIGKHFGMDQEQYSDAFEIVGVFADFILDDTRKEAQPLLLRPRGQVYTGYKEANEQAAEAHSLYLNYLVLEFDREMPDAERLIRTEIGRINPNIPVDHVMPYNEVVANNFNQERLLARLTGAFGVLALILASIGVYGVMSYMTARRTGEIGIRMALGASRGGIVGLMFRSALWQVLAGLVIGVPAALGVCRMMGHLLYEVKSDDPLAFLTAVAALCVGIALAAVLPAMRAASVDPMRALRTE
jgi:predicted permease